MKKTRKKLIISIILVIVAAIGLFIYEETMFSLDAFKFDLQNNILRPSQVYVPEDTSSKLSVSEAEEKLLAYGMDERIVRDMDKVKKREYASQLSMK